MILHIHVFGEYITNLIKLTINDKEIQVIEGTSILEAAKQSKIYIPTLCYDPDLTPYGGCRICVVKVEGDDELVRSCMTKVSEGIHVFTDTPEVKETRKRVLDIIKMDHANNCQQCPKNEKCELQDVSRYIGVETHQSKKVAYPSTLDRSNPFFTLDRSRCILCTKCVRTCQEIQGLGALELSGHGFSEKINGVGEMEINETICESCGQCLDRCPTAALLPKIFKVQTEEVKSICPYCGVGCGIYLGLYYNQLDSIRGDKENPVNKGSLCVKGRFGIVDFVNSFDRLDSPLIKKDGEFVRSSWKEAMDLIAKKLPNYKGEEFACISSAKCTNEENYLIQKFTRTVMRTNNIDHCARLCHSPTVAGLKKAFGSGAMTNSIQEIGNAKCILAIGTNTTETHPIIGLQIRKAVRNGTKLIVGNPRKIDLTRNSTIWLRHKVGSDTALLLGISKVIIEEGLHDKSFIENRCENFEEFLKSLEDISFEEIEKITNIKINEIKKAARMYAQNKPSTILYAMGITQHSHGTDNVLAIANLAMLTGNIGRESSGVNPLRGQNNVQGSCDMGCLPNVLPGYQELSNPLNREKFEKTWDCKLNKENGLTITEMFKSVKEGRIKSMYIVGENPVLSEPDATKVEEALKQLDFLVVQDIFKTETAKFADVILPATTFAEKNGTFTNTERRVQKIRKAIEPIGESKPDWQITCEIAKKLGAKGFDFDNTSKIMDEITSLTPIYGGISHERLENVGLQWPCQTEEHPGTKILHTEKFATENGKGHFTPIKYKPSLEDIDEEYPLLLTTGRSLYQFHTGTMTRQVSGLNQKKGEELVEINSEDATNFGFQDNDAVKVISRRGEVTARIKVTENSPKGCVFMTFHFSESPTNKLTNPGLDEQSKIPELKVCAVRLEKADDSEIQESESFDMDDLFDI